MVMWYWSADTLFWQVSIKRWMSNIKDVCRKLAWYWSNWHTWTGGRTDGRTYVCTDVWLRHGYKTMISRIDWLLYFIKNGAPRAELRYYCSRKEKYSCCTCITNFRALLFRTPETMNHSFSVFTLKPFVFIQLQDSWPVVYMVHKTE